MCGMAWHGTARHGKAREGDATQRNATPRMAWHGLAWHGQDGNNTLGKPSTETGGRSPSVSPVSPSHQSSHPTCIQKMEVGQIGNGT